MIEQTIAALDIAVPQVLLEVEMLDVSKNEIDKIGVNWPQTLAGLTMTGSKGTSFPFGTDRGTSPRGWSMGMGNDTITGINGMEWAFSAWDAMKFGPSVFTLIGSTIAFDFLRQLKDTKYLARPRILTLNNESAEIKITTQEAIGQIQTLSSGGSLTTQTTNQAERVETGVTLRVTPQIDLESGEITMLVVSTVKDTNASSFGGAASTTMKDPEERSTKSVVRVKDGETVIIGGLIRNDSSQQVDKLPLLGDIPIIGGAFRYKNKDKDRERELLVFITPHIIKDSAVKKLTQAKKVSLPEREQGTVSVMDRQTVVSATLNSFEQKN
jgi:type II secretory pathway component GspD/PulD (secretin)